MRSIKAPAGLRHGGGARRGSPGATRGRAVAVAVSAAFAQKAEYIWTDGQEGLKGLYFNEMRSKTKVLQKPIPVGGDFPDWSFDGSRCAGGRPARRPRTSSRAVSEPAPAVPRCC